MVIALKSVAVIKGWNNILVISVQKMEVELEVDPSSQRKDLSPYIDKEKLLAVAYQLQHDASSPSPHVKDR